MRATKDKSVAKKPALLKKKLKGTKRRMLLIFKRAETHSKRRQKKLIFMSEQSSTDYNEHGMKPKLPGQTILLLLLILYQVLEAALAMLYCLLLALPHAAVLNGHEKER